MRDHKHNYVCSDEQLRKLERLAITLGDNCADARPLPELLRARARRSAGGRSRSSSRSSRSSSSSSSRSSSDSGSSGSGSGSGSGAPMDAPASPRICLVGDSFVMQLFYGLECQLDAAGLVRNRTVHGTFHNTAACARAGSPGKHCPQPTAVTTVADGLSLRYVFTGLVSADTSRGPVPAVAAPLCAMAWPLTVATLRRHCGVRPPNALIFGMGSAHCVLRSRVLHRAHEPPLNASRLRRGLERARAVVHEYMPLRAAWLATTYRTHPDVEWCADVEAEFVRRHRATDGGRRRESSRQVGLEHDDGSSSTLQLLDLRSLTTAPPAAALSDGMHFCVPGVPNALMSVWAEQWLA